MSAYDGRGGIHPLTEGYGVTGPDEVDYTAQHEQPEWYGPAFNPPTPIVPVGKRELAREGARSCRALAGYGWEGWALVADIVERVLDGEADEAFDRR